VPRRLRRRGSLGEDAGATQTACIDVDDTPIPPSSGDQARLAPDALRAIGAEQMAGIVIQANAVFSERAVFAVVDTRSMVSARHVGQYDPCASR
jgi:hypothetical protein